MTGISTLEDHVESVATEIDGGYSEDPEQYDETKVVRDAIWNFIEIKPEYLTVLDSPFLQRLRFISQTEFAYMTYPSSQHTRFGHTLGVFHCTKEFLSAIEDNIGHKVKQPYRTEAKLAALLHDIGHGPFSHSSESVYKHHEFFQNTPDRFANAEASEILSHCLIQSSPFQVILDEFVSQSEEVEDIDISNISDMIIGNEAGLPDGYKFLRDMINGPFDVDKFDYLNRDGYFSGLGVSLDTQRILHGIELAGDGSTIHVNYKSLGALEQVFIAKSQLYSRLYHHHKIRAAATLIQRLFRILEDYEYKPVSGIDLDISNPAAYLLLDDTNILGREIPDQNALRLRQLIKTRELPRRALVLSNASFPDVQSRVGGGGEDELQVRSNWGRLENDLEENPERVKREESRITQLTPAEGSVYIDIPPELPGDFSKARPQIKLGRGLAEIRDMSEVFPADSWATTYETYRQRSYIFTDAARNDIPSFTEGALQWLEENDINVSPISVEDAKIRVDELSWDNFLDP